MRLLHHLARAMGLLALLSLGAAAPAQQAHDPANRSGLSWKSGSFVGSNNVELSAGNNPSPRTLLDRVRAFDDWRGRRSDVALQFISHHYFNRDYPDFLQAPALQANLAAFKDAGLIPILSLPLVTLADAGRFAHVAAGNIDRHHQAVADRLRQIMGADRIYLRLGWESDYSYPWSISGHDGAGQPDPAVPADYREAWRRIARIYQGTVPGALLVWNTVKRPPVEWADYYPGDDVVDIISIDLYDNGSGGYFTSDNAAWQQYGLGFYDAATGRVQGMRGVLDFARAHGKKTALDEWGATNKTLSASDGANNDFFIPAVYDFLMANKKDIEYEVYFNFHVGNRGRHQIYPPAGYNPLPSGAYLSRWRP